MGSNKNQGWYIVLLILVLAAVGYFFLQAQSIGGGDGTSYIQAPRFGYLACEVGETQNVQHAMEGQYGQDQLDVWSVATPYTCNDFLGIVEDCRITLQTSDGDVDSLLRPNQQLIYQVVPAGTGFIEDNGETLSGGAGGYNNEERAIIDLEADDVLWVVFREHNFVSFKKVDDKVDFIVNGNPYTLYDYNDLSSFNGQKLDGAVAGSCFLEDSYYRNREIDYNDNAIVELQDQDTYLEWSNLNKIGGRYTYFAGYQPVPNFDQKIETYQGQKAYCLDNSMYKTLDIEVNGEVFEIVNYEAGGHLGDVTCCNGDELPGKICVNHEYVNQEDAQCNPDAGLFCPQSTFQPFGESQYKRFQCAEGQCVAEVIDVVCNDDADCGNGESCVLNTDPTKNACVEIRTGTDAVCGDNFCALSEEGGVCPADCPFSDDNNIGLDPTIVMIIGAFLVIIIGMLVYKKKSTGSVFG